MEKNIAALLREDTRTVQVSFDQVAEDFDELPMDAPSMSGKRTPVSTSPPKPPSAKTYTYVTDLQLGVGDVVVVPARGAMTLAFVRVVSEEVDIEPNCEIRYQWVMAKVDLTGYNGNCARNAEIEGAVAAAYKNSLRRGFAQNILASLDDEHRGKVQALLGGVKS